MSFITPDLKIESMQLCICAVWLTDQVDSSKLLLFLFVCSCAATDSLLTYYGSCDFAKDVYLDQHPLVVLQQLSILVQKATKPLYNQLIPVLTTSA